MPNRGFVTQTISNPNATQASNMIVSTTIFDSASDLDKVLDYSDTNDEILKRIQSVDALCESSGLVIGQVLHSVRPPEQFVPKICVRDITIAAEGKVNDMIQSLSDLAEEDWGVTKGVTISVALGTMNSSAVRATLFFNSLADFEIARSGIMQSSLTSKYMEARAAPLTRIVSRVASFTPASD